MATAERWRKRRPYLSYSDECTWQNNDISDDANTKTRNYDYVTELSYTAQITTKKPTEELTVDKELNKDCCY